MRIRLPYLALFTVHADGSVTTRAALSVETPRAEFHVPAGMTFAPGERLGDLELAGYTAAEIEVDQSNDGVTIVAFVQPSSPSPN